VYPNPASDILNIRFEVPLDGEVELYMLNRKGSLVLAAFIEATTVEKQVSMQRYPPGIYFIRLVTRKIK